MHWPQWTVIFLIALEVGFALAKEGEPRGYYSFWGQLLSAGITIWLLWCGGFFS